MKRILFLIPAVFWGLSYFGCTSNNSPSTPAAPAPTATPSLPTASVTITTAGLSPFAIRYASGGYLWVTDYNNGLQKWTTAGAAALTITTFNGGATFNVPQGLGIDPASGNVYVADTNNNRIDAFTSTGAYINNFGSSQFTTGVLGVAVNSGGTTVFGSGWSPSGLFTFSVAGSIYTYQSVFGQGGSGATAGAAGSCFDSSGNLWVSDFGNKRVVEFDGAGNYQAAVTLTNNGKPQDVAVDPYGNLFVADKINYEIQEFNSSGQHLYDFYASVGQPFGLTLDGTGNYLYVADFGNARIVRFKVH